MNIAVCDDKENIRYLIKKLIDKQAVPCQYVFQGGKLIFSVKNSVADNYGGDFAVSCEGEVPDGGDVINFMVISCNL